MDNILGENSNVNPGTELETGYIFLAQINKLAQQNSKFFDGRNIF